MNTDTLCIKTIKEAANLTAQQNIDADIILPDYYDSIGKILKCEIIPVTEAVTASGDKISVAGIAKFSIIYFGEDGKMYLYENEYKYTKVFQSQYAENSLSSIVKQTVFSLNCRAIAPKRIELRAVLQIGVKIKAESQKTVITSIEDSSVITRDENVSFISTVNSVSRNITLSGSFPLSDVNDSIDIIIRKDSSIKLSEIKTIHNKAYIKGLVETEIFYYSNSSGNTASTVLSIPVSEIIDIFGAEEDDNCSISFNDVYTEIIIKDKDTSSACLDVRVDINLLAEINRNVTEKLITDLYSIKNEIYSEKDTVDLVMHSKKISKNENIVFETDIYDDFKYSVLDSWISNMRISSEMRGSRCNFLVTVMCNALTKNESENLSVITREHTFETELFSENEAFEIVSHSGKVLSVSALQANGGKIRFSADMFFEADVAEICKVTAFTNFEVNDAVRCDSTAKYIIYFAKKDEDIWSLAKENKTSVEAIRAINSLSGDVMTEDKMLLLPSF